MLPTSLVIAERYAAVLSSLNEEMFFSVSFLNAKSLYCRSAFSMNHGSDAYLSMNDAKQTSMKTPVRNASSSSG